MPDEAYERLADALDTLPNGFPRTASGIEVRILQRIFSPDEAALAGCLDGGMQPVGAIAARAGLPVAEARTRLFTMVRRGLAWGDLKSRPPRFRLAPFIVGIYEAQTGTLDHELAHLVEHYLAEGGAAGIMGPEPALHRVVPARQSMKPEWILPYDDVRRLLEGARSLALTECICRKQQALLGRGCSYPLRACLVFSDAAPTPGPDSLTGEEALAFLDQVEELGLVHTVSNVAAGVFYVCNCCGCCCGILRGINECGLEGSVARANYRAVIDAGECQGCLVCLERCQVHALHEQDGVAAVEPERCIGCGLCVTGCPHDAVRLDRKPDAELLHPPADFPAWERQRLSARGLAGPQ